jgi:hypothetical protein
MIKKENEQVGGRSYEKTTPQSLRTIASQAMLNNAPLTEQCAFILGTVS